MILSVVFLVFGTCFVIGSAIAAFSDSSARASLSSGRGSAGLARTGNGMIVAVGCSAGRGVESDGMGLVTAGTPTRNQAVVNKS